MKKFLSLVLALVMTMSLVTISAGAKDFTDNDKVNYDEAVQVISMLGIVNGYEDGSFKPANTLTRGAAAKIIANLKLTPAVADTLKGSKTTFKDVPETNVFSGYIAYCASEGIINGYADGTFRPAGTLNGYAFMKMLLGVLGYDTAIEQYTGSGWEVRVATRANRVGLTGGNDAFSGSKAVTREEAALYAFNTLEAEVVEYENKGQNITINGVTIATGASAAKPIAIAAKDGVPAHNQTYMEANYSALKHTTNTEDSFGRKLSVWTYGKKTVKTVIDNATETYYGAVTGKTLFTDLGLNAKTTYSFNGNDKTGAEIRAMNFGGINHMVLVYVKAGETKDTIKLIDIEYQVGTVTKVVKAKGDDARKIELNDNSDLSLETEDYAKGDVVLYTFANNAIQSIELAKSVEGTVKTTRGATATINGTTYKLADAVKSTVKAGAEGTFYLGVDNSIVKFSGKTVVTSDSFAYVYSVKDMGSSVSDDGFENNHIWKVFFVKADGTKGSANMAADTKDADAAKLKAVTLEAPIVVPYTINSDGEFEVANKDADTATSTAFTANTTEYGKGVNTVDGFYMGKETKFVFVSTEDSKLTTSVATNYQTVVKATGSVYVVADATTKTALTVFVTGTADTETDANYAFLLNATPEISVGADGKNLYTFDVLVQGAKEATTMTTSDSDIFTDKEVAEGNRFEYVLSGETLKSVKKAETNKVNLEVTYIGAGYVAVKDNGTIDLASGLLTYAFDADNNAMDTDTVAVGDIINVYMTSDGKAASVIVITGEAD